MKPYKVQTAAVLYSVRQVNSKFNKTCNIINSSRCVWVVKDPKMENLNYPIVRTYTEVNRVFRSKYSAGHESFPKYKFQKIINF